MPHTSLYGPLVHAVDFMGCDQLHNLKHGENANYTSHRITHEFLQVMSDPIESVQLKALLSSPYYSIIVYETTNISIVKEMVFYVRFISCTDGTIVTSFLKIVELSDCRAETVEEAILAYLLQSGLVEFDNDGAAVMIGRNSGVAKRLKHRQSVLMSIDTDWLWQLDRLEKMFLFFPPPSNRHLGSCFIFYENSAVRMRSLKILEQILNLLETD